MPFTGHLVQGSVFMIGASVGVVIEIKTPTQREAVHLRDELESRLNAAIVAAEGIPVYSSPYGNIEGADLEEIFSEIIKTVTSPK